MSDCFDSNKSIREHVDDIFSVLDENEDKFLAQLDENMRAEYQKIKGKANEEYDFWKKSGEQVVMAYDLLVHLSSLSNFVAIATISSAGLSIKE